MRFAEIQAAVDIAMLRALPGGEHLSSDTALLIALVVYDDYELFPMTAQHEDAIERAKLCGTLNKIDRSKQYNRYSPELLLKSDNHQWQRLRKLENQKFRNGLITVFVSAVLARAPEIWRWMHVLLLLFR